MNVNIDQHLSYDELIQNLVDRTDLEAIRKEHLEACPHCRIQAETLQRRYDRLGQMARELAPQPKHAFRVPESGRTSTGRQFRPVLAMGVAAVLILGLTLLWPRAFDKSQGPPEIAATSAEEENRLMARIDELVDDALPKPYQQLLAVSEPILTEDLIDWIVPSIEEDDEKIKPQA